MIARLDANHFDENELLQIKVALHTPYIQNSGEYERCDGQIEYKGVQYNYVKRMVYNDTLYLYCIPNTEGTRILKTKNFYAEQNNGNLPERGTGQSVMKKINLANEYDLISQDFNMVAQNSPLAHPSMLYHCEVTEGCTSELFHPPDLSI
ncbi:MAG: hypothetical protein KGM98_15900 [Bacteroidota bacterium]|nr:hypothetical protein [Bacteroidota bacterium]